MSTLTAPRPASAPTSAARRAPGRRTAFTDLVGSVRRTASACREATRAARHAFRTARDADDVPDGALLAPGPDRAPVPDAVRHGGPGSGAVRPGDTDSGRGPHRATGRSAGRTPAGTERVPGTGADAGTGIDSGSGGSGDAAAGGRPRRRVPFDTGYRPRSVALRQRARDVAELVRAPAALSVPGDVIAGALAVGRPAGGRTLLLAASSVSLYWAGMALNDWADREEDAAERPERPVPSGRVGAGTALGIAAGLTAVGLGLAAPAGGRRVLLRRTLPLAAAVWAYDLGLKHTPFGPLAMAAARALDVLHGTGPAPAGPAVRAAATVGVHTWAVTRLSRHEVTGEAGREPLLSLAVTAVTALAASGLPETALRRAAAVRSLPETAPRRPATPRSLPAGLLRPDTVVSLLACAAYVRTCVRAQWAALRGPADAARVRGAVGAGIHALLPLQAGLVARCGAPRTAVLLAAGLPQAARLARKVSPT
ncbi:SCO3242 family prenyltransferase [Streptomyces mexicanus]|uniref:SCO3242 family prenyltransferase n=1 Tax=Streptomyces mexicanus TaxID=178566 RepID=UPI0036C0C046